MTFLFQCLSLSQMVLNVPLFWYLGRLMFDRRNDREHRIRLVLISAVQTLLMASMTVIAFSLGLLCLTSVLALLVSYNARAIRKEETGNAESLG